VGVVFREPLRTGRGWECVVLWAYHTVSLEESDEMAEALRRFGEVAGTVACEPGDIVLYHGVVHRADGNALSMQPSGKLITGMHRALDMARRIAFVVEESGEVVEVWPQGTTAQSGNHG
jgi:NTP pyrophosphatase (non-canonical NTP hydrolase)